jgi:AcrR family transcriptional regulator
LTRVGSDATRARILDMAWNLMTERGVGQVTLADVARAAGISRQALYLHFGSRAGLLVAMTHARDEQLGLPDRLRELRELPARERLRRLLDAWLDHIPRIQPIAVALEAAALAGDADARAAWDDRMEELRLAIGRSVYRVAEAGALRSPWTAATATDWIWAQAHVATWQHLVGDRKWPPGRAKRTILETLLAAIVAAPDAKRPAPVRRPREKSAGPPGRRV